MEEQIPPPKGFWSNVGNIVSSPVAAISKMTKESPAMTLIAILLVVQPIVQTGIDLVKGLIEFKQDLDPKSRPSTRAELDIVNAKIDFLQQLIVNDMKNDAERETNRHRHISPPVDNTQPKPVDFDTLKKSLADVQHKADEDFRLHAKK